MSKSYFKSAYESICTNVCLVIFNLNRFFFLIFVTGKKEGEGVWFGLRVDSGNVPLLTFRSHGNIPDGRTHPYALWYTLYMYTYFVCIHTYACMRVEDTDSIFYYSDTPCTTANTIPFVHTHPLSNIRAYCTARGRSSSDRLRGDSAAARTPSDTALVFNWFRRNRKCARDRV